MHSLRRLTCTALLLFLGLRVKGDDDNLLRNPTFQTSGDNTVPDNWSLRETEKDVGDGGTSGLGGTTTKAMVLKSIDPNTPSVFFQSVPTLSSIDYRLTFDAFCSDSDKGQQNLTVSFGTGTWSVQPPGQWQFYTFSARGKGSDDVVKFSGVDTSGGGVYMYNLALVSLGADNSPSATSSATPSSAQTSMPGGGPSVIPAPAGSDSSSLSKGALIATILSPIFTILGAMLTWWKWEDVRSCCGCRSRRRRAQTPAPRATYLADDAKIWTDSVEELPLVSHKSTS
ncbi:hypothetical protein DFH08DRAFT_799388 [Mycena albidolilacea]|uniref:Uncharacterized protein n=1 Tax=Mycena albidolilacea TaxID=1033008 RepID=A0AAD7F2Z1_9AGAR|nr:hypothetical protein DFH08DRAFT_799388 [Mycena albidolilacea]